MAQQVIQTSLHSGEWAPQLYARVDLQKYHAGAALMRNFYVDYRGGASTRMGSKYILQAFKSSTKVRLIPFQASFTVNYALEFGDKYIRFHTNGAPVVEATTAITGATQANPCVITDVAHGYSTGDWVLILNVGGMTQLNGKYFRVTNLTANTFSLQKVLDGSNVNSTSFTAYTSGGTAARVYTVATSYAAADLALLKFVQEVNTMIITHPNYAPQKLVIAAPASWTITPISFGPTISAPTGITVTATLATGGLFNYGYVVTSLDINGQESGISTIGTINSLVDIMSNAGSIIISWTAATGAQSYNVYKCERAYNTPIAAGVQFGFIGNVQGTKFQETTPGIAADFSQSPPLTPNLALGQPVGSVTMTAPGSYISVPSVSFTGGGGTGAAANAVLQVVTPGAIINPGSVYFPGEHVNLSNQTGGTIYATIVVLTTSGGGVTSYAILSSSSVYSGSVPSDSAFGPSVLTDQAGGGFVSGVVWGVTSTPITNGGSYATAPSVVYSFGAAAGTAVLSTSGGQFGGINPLIYGNPAVPGFHQQRLVLAAPPQAVNTFFGSQPGFPFNFDTNNPIIASDAFQGTIVSTKLHTIKSMLSLPLGLLMFTDQGAWIIDGGGKGTAATAVDLAAEGQAYNGASDVPPIIANQDLLYVQSKGTIIRDMTYNFYTSIYTGTDITILSGHLFFGFQINEWAFAEEPFRVVWCVRNDGIMLSLTFVKEQELVGWAHHDTQGTYQSICSIVEATNGGNVDAIYTVVQRTINGNIVQYIERMADRFIGSYNDSTIWCVDAGLQYGGAATATFSGLDHLVGATITGVADGVVPTAPGGGPLVVSAAGSVTLATPASIVTLGLAYTPQLQTLPLDLGEPTVQGKRKKIAGYSVRCQKTLGLSIGRNFSTLVTMKGLQIGQTNEYLNAVVTDLVSADARTIVDPLWDVPGQVSIQQSTPFPATILGVIPEIVVGDTVK